MATNTDRQNTLIAGITVIHHAVLTATAAL
jgi:hypothetical protein